MMRRAYVFSGLMGLLVLMHAPVLACTPDSQSLEYALQRGQMVYRGSALSSLQIVRYLPDVNPQRFHSLLTGAKVPQHVRQELWQDGLSYLHPAYFGDGEKVVWQGTVLQNPFNTPVVEAGSLQQPFADSGFAFDANSLYFRGVWTGLNPGLDSENIKRLGRYLTSDGQYLIYQGEVVGEAAGYQLLESLPNEQNTDLRCDAWPHEVASTHKNIYLNGMPLNVDPEHFKVVRWLPKSGTLYYRDQFGQHVVTVTAVD